MGHFLYGRLEATASAPTRPTELVQYNTCCGKLPHRSFSPVASGKRVHPVPLNFWAAALLGHHITRLAHAGGTRCTAPPEDMHRKWYQKRDKTDIENAFVRKSPPRVAQKAPGDATKVPVVFYSIIVDISTRSGVVARPNGSPVLCTIKDQNVRFSAHFRPFFDRFYLILEFDSYRV